MRALITFESVYGNTRAIAEAVAEGLRQGGEVTVASHDQVDPEEIAAANLLVVGAPTHMHGLPTSLSRKMAAKASEEDGVPLDSSATADPGIRSWLSEQTGDGRAAAAFDTRIDKSPALTGSAARGIGKRLRRRGFKLAVEPESFFVEDAEGPLADGELDRAREWGRTLANEIGSTLEETAR
jgi:sulfite reductase alpha subunit-like flavoprotein